MLIRALLLVALLCAANSGHAVTHEVVLSGLSFIPSQLTIQVGDTVRWRNQSGFHDVVADDASFSSGPATTAPFTFEVTFDTPGTFGYFCSIHGGPGSGMAGTIIVEGTAPPPDPLPPDINFATSGAWYNAGTTGQGFFVEAFPGANVFTFAWFTWIGDGEHDWFVGTGLYEGPTATFDVFRVVGGRFNDPTPVSDSVIGTGTFTLIDCTHAEFAFDLTDPVRAGTIALERILPSDDDCVLPAAIAPLRAVPD